MRAYSEKELRRAILEVLKYIAFSELQVSSLLNALRREFNDLIEATLMTEIIYLEKKGYLEIHNVTNYITKKVATMIVITPRGMDLLAGDCADVGVSCG